MFEKLPVKQMLRIVKSHIITSVIMFIIGLFAAVAVFGTTLGMIIFTIISMLIYFVITYAEAYDIAKRDKKKITKEEPYFCKGFLLPLLMIAITVILYIGYYISWTYLKDARGILGIIRWILHFVFLVWSFPFNIILNPSKGLLNWYGYIVIILVPVIFSGIGYIAGLKDFDISVKMSKFIYESKEDNK